MELREALSQISEIRQQVARTELFRGYRAMPVAFSGLLAMAGAAFQGYWLAEPAQNPSAFLTLWLGVAGISLLAMGMEMSLRLCFFSSPLERSKTGVALGQFLPCVVAGGLLTLVLGLQAPETLWMLPGLWALLFSLGIFASQRLLPRATCWAGVFYMGAAMACLMLARGEYAFSPWAMGLPFGLGQLLTAAILYWNLERDDVEKP